MQSPTNNLLESWIEFCYIPQSKQAIEECCYYLKVHSFLHKFLSFGIMDLFPFKNGLNDL